MDLEINFCLHVFYYTTTPPSVNAYLFIDFESLVLYFQLASLYPSSIAE